MKFKPVDAVKKRNAAIFKRELGYDLDYNSPKTFNEKLNWLKFNYRDPMMTTCSGKDTVRSYIRQVLGGSCQEFLVGLVGQGVYSSAAEINFNELPDQFVLKLNNGSGKNLIVSDKSKINIDDTRALLDKWLHPSSNHYYNFYEWGYKNVKPRIVCEEYLGDWGSVRDYKFFCFNGEPGFVYVSNEYDSRKEQIDMKYLTLDWESKDYVRKSYKPSKFKIPRPDALDLMIDTSKKLSAKFPFVRVDFFDIGGVPKIAELTFYPSAGYGGFESIEHDRQIGDMLKLPNQKRPARLYEMGYFND